MTVFYDRGHMTRHVIELPTDSTPVAVRLGDTDLLIANVDGRWHAVEDRCSHAGCAFSTDGDLDGTTLTCDCHGSEFDLLTGRALSMPESRPIRTFPVREAAGRLEVEI